MTLTFHQTFSHFNKKLFHFTPQEVTKLSKLESLVISLDGLTTIQGLQNLQTLKELELKTNKDETVEFFKDFSKLRFEKLEKLTLNLFYFDIPEEVYQAMSQNLPNLKSLRVTLGNRHSINFFARTFPQIEELHVRFGSSNNHLTFNQALERNSKDVQRNLKKIEFSFQGDSKTNIDDFSAFLNIFPNLESLDISTDFSYSTELFAKIDENLNNLKSLKLSSISIDSYETFPVETSNAMKNLAGKLKFIQINFTNVRRMFDRNYNDKFSFGPFINELKGDFRYDEDGISTIHDYTTLVIEAGLENWK